MKVTETQGPRVKVNSIAGENAGSSEGNSGAVYTTQLINVRVQREAGRYSVDDKVTRDERGGMSSGKGEEDEDLGILFRGERGPKLAA